MSHRYDPTLAIDLPRLDARGAVALCTALLAAASAAAADAEGQKLPAGVERVRQRLQAALDVLAAALRDRGQPPPADAGRLLLADRAEDAAWSALHAWLSGWMRLPGAPPEAAEAEAIFKVLFPDGLKFTRLAFKLEWAETDARLQRIAKEGFGPTLQALGGQPFLDALQATHKEYGEAQNITQAKAAAGGASAAAIRAPRDALLTQLRSYVFQAAAQGDEEDPASQALVERLLRPLDEWKIAHAAIKPATPETSSSDPR